jgi:hypothetical protein
MHHAIDFSTQTQIEEKNTHADAVCWNGLDHTFDEDFFPSLTET